MVWRDDVGSELSAASGRGSEVSEWPRSKFPASAVRQHRNFGHRNRIIVPYGGFGAGAWVLRIATASVRTGFAMTLLLQEGRYGIGERTEASAPTGALLVVRRAGALLPTVVPTDSRALSCPPIGALPRNRLASSATGGASPISPPAGDRKGRPYESVTRGAGESGIPQSRLCRASPL